MVMNGITATVVNGVQEVTTTNTISTTGGATDESILIYGATAAIRAIGTGDITFTRCNFYILDTVNSTTSPNGAVLSYNGDNSTRTDSDSFIRFIDSQIIYDNSLRKNLFISELTRSKIIHQDSANTLYIYTQPNAILDGVLFQGTQTWEVVGAPSVAANLRMDDVTYGFLNFEAGRLDFLGINVTNSITADAWLGTGNSGNNSAYMWDNISFNATKIRLQSVNGVVYIGNSASYKFVDLLSNENVSDVLVIFDSNFGGTRVEKGRFVTNSNGVMVGTYDSRFNTTGSNQERPTLFCLTQYTDQAGSTYSASGNTYDLVNVTSYLEVRSFLHDAPTGFSASDSFDISTKKGSLSANYSVNTYELFRLKPDTNLTETNKATVLAYTTLDTTAKVYDRAKAEWRDNDDYWIPNRDGTQLKLTSNNLIIDATAASPYVWANPNITIKSSTFTGGATATTGAVTTVNGTLLSGGTFDCDVNYQSGAGTTLTNVTVNGTLDFSIAGTYTLQGCAINEVTNSSGGNVVLNLANGSTITTNTGPNITLVSSTSFSLTGLKTNSEVRVYEAGTTNEIDGVENSGTSFTTVLNTSAVDFVVFALGYQPIRQLNVSTTSNVSIPIQQTVDRVYNNP